MYSKNFKKILLSESFVWETRFGPFLPQIGVKKSRLKKKFLKKNSEKYFFKKISKIISFI
jgi:hypothetical protein